MPTRRARGGSADGDPDRIAATGPTAPAPADPTARTACGAWVEETITRRRTLRRKQLAQGVGRNPTDNYAASHDARDQRVSPPEESDHHRIIDHAPPDEMTSSVRHQSEIARLPMPDVMLLGSA